jgi:glycopeptide antibiotics resistance protein
MRYTSPLACILAFFIILFILVLWLFIIRKQRSIKTIVYAVAFSVSLTLILMFTVLRKTEPIDFGFDRAFISLKSVYSVNLDLYTSFLCNVILFVPFAFVLRWKTSAKLTVVTCVVLSVCIEMIQMFCKIGVFEISDILGNSLGALIAILLYQLGMVVIKAVRKRNNKTSE